MYVKTFENNGIARETEYIQEGDTWPITKKSHNLPCDPLCALIPVPHLRDLRISCPLVTLWFRVVPYKQCGCCGKLVD